MQETATPRRSRAPWVILGLVSPLFVVVIVLSSLNGSFNELFVFIALSMIVGYTTVGALLAAREPTNPIGWIMMTMGIGFIFSGLTSEWVIYTYLTDPGGLPFREAIVWINGWVVLLTFGPAPLFLAIFPTGRVPSRRWRFLPPALFTALGIALVSWAFEPTVIEGDGVSVQNPYGIEALGGVLQLLALASAIAIVVLMLLSVVALALRYRRSTGDERQQMRLFVFATWLGTATLVMALLIQMLFGTTWVEELFFYAFFALLGFGLPVAIAVGILRYRLYDIDLVIKKAAVFVVLVVLLFAIAVVAVVVASSPVFERLYDAPPLMIMGGIAFGLLLVPLYRASRRIADRLVYRGRADPYEVLAGFSDRMGEAYATEDVLERMATVLRSAVGASVARVWLHTGDELVPSAADPPDAPALEPVHAHGDELPSLAGEWAVDVRDRGELLGALSVLMPANDPINPSKERLVRDLAGQAGLVLRNVRLIEDLRASRRRIVSAQDERARRLERDIHDGAQQQLVALAVQLRLARSLVERDAAKATAMLESLETAVGETLDDLRDLARGIYPPLLADAGLVAAIQAQGRKAAVDVVVEATDVGRYPPDVESTIYFCTLEAITNAAKYAGTDAVAVHLRQDDGRLDFAISDTGRGFDPATAPHGSGLRGMSDRVEAVGGSLRVTSQPGEGTTVTGSVPVAAAAYAEHAARNAEEPSDGD